MSASKGNKVRAAAIEAEKAKVAAAEASGKPLHTITARSRHGQTRIVEVRRPGQKPEHVWLYPAGAEFLADEAMLAAFAADPLVQVQDHSVAGPRPLNLVEMPSLVDALPKGSQKAMAVAIPSPKVDPTVLPIAEASLHPPSGEGDGDSEDDDQDEDEDDDEREPVAGDPNLSPAQREAVARDEAARRANAHASKPGGAPAPAAKGDEKKADDKADRKA